jgi:hypothetical protein
VIEGHSLPDPVFVSMGNPHVVFFVSEADLDLIPLNVVIVFHLFENELCRSAR